MIAKMLRNQRIVTWALVAVAIASLFIVPVGIPYTYGRLIGTHYVFYFTKPSGAVLDDSRIWMQFLVLGIAWAALYFSAKDKPAP